MSTFLNKLSAEIVSTDKFKSSSNALFDAYVQKLIEKEVVFGRDETRKLVAAAQVFLQSEDSATRNEGAVLLSLLLDVCGDSYQEILAIAHSQFSNAGDFPNVNLLRERYPNIEFKYSFLSEAQMDLRQELNTVPELDFPLTDYQRSLWNDLTSDLDVITSAPTSAGKTHIILSYILRSVSEGDGAFAAIVVPTRALISEVAAKLYELAKGFKVEQDIEVCTLPRKGESKKGLFKDKTLFVMTQERLHEILQSGDVTFNYLFIDEAHNITDQNRGVLLHLTIEKLLEDSTPQIIISMPSDSYQDSFSSIFREVVFEKEITRRSPVTKIVMTVQPQSRNLILSRHGSFESTAIKKEFNGTDLADIVLRLGRGQSNIVFRNGAYSAENIAGKIAKSLPDQEPNEALEEAASYIEGFVHSEFSLATCLRKGVAFHYGPLPSSVRVMVENLVKDNLVNYVACTSTLAEGVNLPAKNLFLEDPKRYVRNQPSARIENVKINNITGRAGRMLHHFSGNIFLIRPSDWAFQDYFEEEKEEAKIPTYFKSLNEELGDVHKALQGQIDHNHKDQYRLYTIANKLIKEHVSEKLGDTLSSGELTLSAQQKSNLTERVKAANANLRVPTFTLEASPTVGYIQQNKLHSFLENLDAYDAWVLPHPKSAGLYDTLVRVTGKLNEFGVYTPYDGYTLKQICTLASKWVRGDSLREMIIDQIEWDKKQRRAQGNPPNSVNKCVRDVIHAINNDVRFRLSNALRCYQVLLTNVLLAKGLDLTNVKLHSFIEIGACEDRLINLINLGLSREAAIDIDENLGEGQAVDTSRDLIALNGEGALGGIHNVSRKELESLLKP